MSYYKSLQITVQVDYFSLTSLLVTKTVDRFSEKQKRIIVRLWLGSLKTGDKPLKFVQSNERAIE